MINVTKTFLPPIDEYQEFIKIAYNNNWLTNRGELVISLEEKLKKYLKVKNIIATSNGTLPIHISLKALELKNEIITTPFSYVATTSSIVWEKCNPVFVDIHPEYLTIDESKIEAAITKNTTGILATHVYGNPCHLEIIQKIANKYSLKVIYDAAHAFAVEYNNSSIFNYGDVSTCSFHATKIFHTGEGGGLFTNDEKLFKKLYSLHNFGHSGPNIFTGVGLNAKMSELQAAMGLSILPYMNMIIEKRKKIINKYISDLKNVNFLKIREKTKWNYSYFPVIFEDEALNLKVINQLKENNIFPRRYFFPSLNKLDYLTYQSCPNAEKIASGILCLPLYDSLKIENVDQIIKIINKST